MLNIVVSATKITLSAFWVAWALSIASLIPQPYGKIVLWVGGLLLLIHLVEYLAMKTIIARRNNGEVDFIQTLLFGYGHWLPMLLESRRTTDGSMP